jgi:hypothetical protein
VDFAESFGASSPFFLLQLASARRSSVTERAGLVFIVPA